MATTTEPSKTEVLSKKVRFSYSNVWEPKAFGNNPKKKYSVTLLIPKSDKQGVKILKDAFDAAYAQGVADKFKGKKPKQEKLCWKDGDVDKEDGDANYAGHFYVAASSDMKPHILDAAKKEIMIQSEFYSGCYGRALVNFYPWVFEGVPGVSCGLNAVQKLEDGDAFSSRPSLEDAAKAFGADDDDSLI